MSGHLGNLSADQEKMMNQLRVNIQDVITPRVDDQYLLRFLRARKWDLDKAEKKIRATLEFRKKWGADTILKDYTPPKLLVDYFPEGYLPDTDETGHPVVLLCLGNIDLKGMMKSFSREELFKFKVYTMENLEDTFLQCTKNQGKLVDTITALIDMQGLSAYHLWKPGLLLWNEFMQVEEMHYPEIVNKGYFINCPRIFGTIYAFCKPFIDPNTRDKLDILGSNWKERLKEIIPEHALLEEYGGKVKRSECKNLSFGGRIPKEFYKENDDSLQHQYIKPGKSHTIEVQVEKSGSELSWEFVTENHDISFGVYYVENGNNVAVVASERISAHLGNVDGSHPCEKTGTYVLEWDNSFSWTRGKNLKYKYDLIIPDENGA